MSYCTQNEKRLLQNMSSAILIISALRVNFRNNYQILAHVSK